MRRFRGNRARLSRVLHAVLLVLVTAAPAGAAAPFGFAPVAAVKSPSLELRLAPAALGPIVESDDLDGAPLALATAFPTPDVDVRIGAGTGSKPSTEKKPKKASKKAPRRPRGASMVALTPERAQALLRSITVPGWGQASLGHPTAGAVFAIAEAGIWGTFTAFRIQERLRRDAAARTARVYAGINLEGRDEEFLKIVGAFASSEEYNQLVVFRDAANLYYDEPDKYRAYIAQHSLGGSDTWNWQDADSFFRYGAQRKDAQRASLRANTSLALAIGNRLVSMLHVARLSGKALPTGAGSWNLEVVPDGGHDPTAYHYGVRVRF